ncbi:hypothetical protein [Phenylobacterium kunshanense]|uniref:XRE family transcriptional regulator n=1 Tax=Phenylobacterium kunshanense TaxID=1445034 RepID=A0A328BQ37_9CAUL|nr:hypothetical protein [Phenylobacterium kunshanense]RAK68785.1 hypothetical protein DJ019_01880 [Phenylobacterium kunshanense]
MLTEFERDCAAADVSPVAALKAGGVHPTLWSKWKSGMSPTLKNFQRARSGLEALKRERAA